LVWHQEERPACKILVLVLVWLSVWSEVQMICVWSSSADATATPSSIASLKSRMVLLLWCWLIQVALEKRPLNSYLFVSLISYL